MAGRMRVGLLADTHDRLPAVAELIRRFAERDVTLVMHAGDYCAPFSLAPFREASMPLLGVFGRNDGDREGLVAASSTLPAGGELFESPHSFEIAGRSVLLVHDVGDVPARSLEAHAIVVHGCAHQAEMHVRGSTLLVNPGEGCGWLHGAPGGAILDLAARTVEFVTLTEAQWRA
jgi:putative phosphoesterase